MVGHGSDFTVCLLRTVAGLSIAHLCEPPFFVPGRPCPLCPGVLPLPASSDLRLVCVLFGLRWRAGMLLRISLPGLFDKRARLPKNSFSWAFGGVEGECCLWGFNPSKPTPPKTPIFSVHVCPGIFSLKGEDPFARYRAGCHLHIVAQVPLSSIGCSLALFLEGREGVG